MLLQITEMFPGRWAVKSNLMPHSWCAFRTPCHSNPPWQHMLPAWPSHHGCHGRVNAAQLGGTSSPKATDHSGSHLQLHPAAMATRAGDHWLGTIPAPSPVTRGPVPKLGVSERNSLSGASSAVSALDGWEPGARIVGNRVGRAALTPSSLPPSSPAWLEELSRVWG